MHVDAVATSDVKRVLRPLALAGKRATARMVAGRPTILWQSDALARSDGREEQE